MGLGHKIAPRCLDHHGGPTGVHLHGAQVGVVLQHRLVHQAGSPRPSVCVGRIAQHRCEADVRMRIGPGLGLLGTVQVCAAATAPVQVDGPGDAARHTVCDHGLDGRKTGARAQHDHGRRAVLAQVKRAQGHFDLPNFAQLHGAKHMVGEHATGHVADVQLELAHPSGLGHGGDGVAAPRAIGAQHINELASAKLHRLVGRQAHSDDAHIRCGRVKRQHPCGHALRAEVPIGVDLFHLDHQVAQGRGAAQQGMALGALGLREVFHMGVTKVHLT